MKTQTTESFRRVFGSEPAVTARAPGRLEILGNHTDYNEGTVLSAAVDRCICTAVSPVDGVQCTVYDENFGESRQFSIDDIAAHVPGDWSGYVKGMVLALVKRGIKVPAFNAVLKGDVPLSAGMSSSAALEMSVGLALCAISGGKLDWLDMAKAGQDCENNYIGANTGLLDQFSSLRGEKDCLIYSDFRSMETSRTAMPGGYGFVVINSMVKHVLTNEYNDRRLGCQRAVKCISASVPEVKALRDVSMETLLDFKSSMDSAAFDCAMHVVGEMERVANGIAFLKSGNIEAFGRLMFESHESSRIHFRNSCSELDRIVEIAAGNPACLGARLSGGGFGGISVHLVKAAEAENYAGDILEAYESATGARLQAIVCLPADGAAII